MSASVSLGLSPRLLACVGGTVMSRLWWSQYQWPPRSEGRAHRASQLAGPVSHPRQSHISSQTGKRWQVEARTETSSLLPSFPPWGPHPGLQTDCSKWSSCRSLASANRGPGSPLQTSLQRNVPLLDPGADILPLIRRRDSWKIWCQQVYVYVKIWNKS